MPNTGLMFKPGTIGATVNAGAGGVHVTSTVCVSAGHAVPPLAGCVVIVLESVRVCIPLTGHVAGTSGPCTQALTTQSTGMGVEPTVTVTERDTAGIVVVPPVTVLDAAFDSALSPPAEFTALIAAW
jgi:hypothetical protein